MKGRKIGEMEGYTHCRYNTKNRSYLRSNADTEVVRNSLKVGRI